MRFAARAASHCMRCAVCLLAHNNVYCYAWPHWRRRQVRLCHKNVSQVVATLARGSATEAASAAVQARLRGTSPAALALAAETRALLQASLARLRALLPDATGSREPDPGPIGSEPDQQTLETALQGLADLAWERRECCAALRLYVQARLRGAARDGES